MAFNGAGTKHVSTIVVATGTPGGSQIVTAQVQPLGSYPALGETLASLLLLLPQIKVAVGQQPDNVIVSGQQQAGYWVWDPVQKTFRFFTSLVPAEHVTGVYTAGELAAIFRFTMFFPLFGSTSR